MWCYQKPGFEALLLTELQRQQQCSQFCDTLLQAEGVSVPAHSCILSAISPHFSSALSSKLAPPSGQKHLLEFQALGACTLLHMVRLIYSGEMAGEGENEKQEAISAAAKLGIHGLVEVTKRRSRGVGEMDNHTEVGVEMEPLRTEDNKGRQGRWRREVRDGSTFLWKEVLSNSGKDMWTQTEELHINTDPPAHQAASYETIDVGAFQSLEQTDSHQFVPITFVYPPDESQMIQLSSAASACEKEPTAAEGTSVAVVVPARKSIPPSHPHFSNQTVSGVPDPQTCWAGPQGAGRDVTAAEEWEDECFEQFQGNIPGFISHFLNTDNKEGAHRGRARRRQRAGVGGARRAGTGEQRARRPRGRGGFTEKVDVQEIGVSKLHKVYLHKWRMRTLRTGQGGGAVGRMLYLNSRDLLKPTRGGYQRRRGRGKLWEFSQSRDAPLSGKGRGNNTQRGKKDKQGGPPVGRTQTSKKKSTPVSFSASHKQFHNTSSPSLQASPSHSLQSPATSYLSPASSLLHTTPLRPPATLSHEDQPEQIDRLLEEVMRGLDILPNSNNRPTHSQCSLPASSSVVNSSGNTLAQNKWQSHINGTEVPVLQQRCEGELNEILENFLQSFENHVESCSAREEDESGDANSSEVSVSHTDSSIYKRAKIGTSAPHTPHLQDQHMPFRVSPSQTSEVESDQTGLSQRWTQPHKVSTHCDMSSEHAKETKPTRQKKRRHYNYLFSLEKKKVKVKKPKTIDVQTHEQLQQMPVIKLQRGGLTQQGQSLDHKSSSESAVKCSHDNMPGKNKQVLRSTKTYPIRSRFREAGLVNPKDKVLFLEEPLPVKKPPSANQPTRRGRGRPRNNSQLLSPSNNESGAVLLQLQSVDSCSTDNQLEKHQERLEEELIAQSQEEAETPAGRGEKRRTESNEDMSDDTTVSKKICLEHTKQTNCETFTPSSESGDLMSAAATAEQGEVEDLETVSLTGVKDYVQGSEQKKESTWTAVKVRKTEERLTDEEMESSADEIIDVERDQEDCETVGNKKVETDHYQSRTASALSHISDAWLSVSPSRPVEELSLDRTEKWGGDEDEDIDVVGVSSPAPEPVIISWTESSEGEENDEEEEVDVDDKTDCSSSVIFTAVSNVNTTCQTEVPSH